MEKNNRLILLIILGIFGIFSLLSSVLAHSGEDDFSHHEMMERGTMMGGWGYGGMIFGWLFSVLILVALVLFIVWLIKQIQKPPRRR